PKIRSLDEAKDRYVGVVAAGFPDNFLARGGLERDLRAADVAAIDDDVFFDDVIPQLDDGIDLGIAQRRRDAAVGFGATRVLTDFQAQRLILALLFRIGNE